MNNLKYKVLAELKTEAHVEKFHEVLDKFDASLQDNFMTYWIALLYFYPLQGSLKDVFEKMDTDSKRVGVLSRHLIKRAKESEIPQNLIDEYVSAKNQVKQWEDFYDRMIKDNKDKLTSGIRQSLESAKKIGKYEQKKRQQRQTLHKRTFGLINKLINHRVNNRITNRTNP